MGSDAGYLLVALGGGTYRTTFRVEILAPKFKNGREIQKTSSKMYKNGRENSKKAKKFLPLRGENVLFQRRPVLSSACQVRPRGGVEGS